ncbi:hypothetical protein KIW84_040563 [Lathyrus oleraceus]|uniref:Uncharacterized protein n=1 Tax=Pisum sativum TaxID=3888 RepID=A0A9D4X5U2_PEA|nr:hypothetical protein KIW84_040563 [Pisum sativum]
MPADVRAPIPEEQQREVFKWMLEEKRKMKPKDAMEKKQIDEEKDILKQFLRSDFDKLVSSEVHYLLNWKATG